MSSEPVELAFLGLEALVRYHAWDRYSFAFMLSFL
jgi:hypothetical protein